MNNPIVRLPTQLFFTTVSSTCLLKLPMLLNPPPYRTTCSSTAPHPLCLNGLIVAIENILAYSRLRRWTKPNDSIISLNSFFVQSSVTGLTAFLLVYSLMFLPSFLPLFLYLASETSTCLLDSHSHSHHSHPRAISPPRVSRLLDLNANAKPKIPRFV